MNEDLKKALEELFRMQYPSVEKLLRGFGYGYEANKLHEVEVAFRNACRN